MLDKVYLDDRLDTNYYIIHTIVIGIDPVRALWMINGDWRIATAAPR